MIKIYIKHRENHSQIVKQDIIKSLGVMILSCFCLDQPCGCFDVRQFTLEGAPTVLESSDKHDEVEPCVDESKL